SLRLVDGKLREDPEANRLFLEILASRKDPETALRRMNEAGVFGRFIPDFGRVVAQMQYDMYHVYTVDEHTLFAIGILHKVETGQSFVDRVQSPARLKLLLVLTAADIRAVGPKVWNGWKAALLREVYYSALDVISGGLTVEARDARIAAAQAAARELLPDFTD